MTVIILSSEKCNKLKKLSLYVFRSHFQTTYSSPMLHLQAIKLRYFCRMPHRLTESFWRFFTRHQTPSHLFTFYLLHSDATHQRGCSGKTNFEESWRRDKFPKRRVLTRHSILERCVSEIGRGFFSLHVGASSVRADVCICVYI